MGVNTTLHCANIICSIVCHAISYLSMHPKNLGGGSVMDGREGVCGG